jgi:hypothetical protein
MLLTPTIRTTKLVRRHNTRRKNNGSCGKDKTRRKNKGRRMFGKNSLLYPLEDDLGLGFGFWHRMVGAWLLLFVRDTCLRLLCHDACTGGYECFDDSYLCPFTIGIWL